MGPEVWFVLLLFVVVTIPAFVGVVVFVNRVTGANTEDELEDLKRRVEELEAERD